MGGCLQGRQKAGLEKVNTTFQTQAEIEDKETKMEPNDDINPEELDDDTLFLLLQHHGLPAGPIMPSTRPLYEKMFMKAQEGLRKRSAETVKKQEQYYSEEADSGDVSYKYQQEEEPRNTTNYQKQQIPSLSSRLCSMILMIFKILFVFLVLIVIYSFLVNLGDKMDDNLLSGDTNESL